MKRTVYLGAIALCVACSSDEGAEVDDQERTIEIPEDVDVDPFQKRMIDVDTYIDSLEATGGFTGSYLKKGNAVQFIDMFTYLVNDEIVKLEAYLYKGSERTSERFYFQDKRIVRYDRFTKEFAAGQGMEQREESHYFDDKELLFRSSYKEAAGAEDRLLEDLPMQPLIEYNMADEQDKISRKILIYTMEMDKAEEIDYNSEEMDWPYREWDVEELKNAVLDQQKEATEE